MARVRQLDVDQLGAQLGRQLERGVEAFANARIDTVFQLGPRHTEANAVESTGLGQHDRLAQADAGGVALGTTGNHLLQERAIAHRQRHWSNLLERAGEGNDAEARDGAVRGHQTNEATEGGGLSNRATRIGTERPRSKPCCDDCGRATRRAAGHARLVPRIACRAIGRVLGRGAHRKLVEVRLAETDEPSRIATSHDIGILERNEALEDLRAGRRRHTLGREQILVCDRDAR